MTLCQIGGMSPASKTPASDASALESFNQICTVRIELIDTDPLIWREVDVPTSITLKVLHDIVQITMGWLDYHLWEFTIGKQRYGLPMDEDWGTAPRTEAIKVRLRDVLKPRKTTIEYLYDFGDSWAHRLTVTGIRQGTHGVSYPHYVGGAWDCPPEDCGGTWGYSDLLKVLRNPAHPEYKEMKAWVGRKFDAEVFDVERFSKDLRRLRSYL